MREFVDHGSAIVHEGFQAWRREHATGFFVNLQAIGGPMLHRTTCFHAGDNTHPADAWGSLTRSPKLCSTDVSELARWAASKNVLLRPCTGCRPGSP
jgi:hypothetical protein